MNNLFFKSRTGLIKNSSISIEATLMMKLDMIQKELRHQRQDHKDITMMLNKLLVDKHLQMQVDNYFEGDEETSPQTDSDEQEGN